MPPGTGWFADLSDEEDQVEGSPWQPFLQADAGCWPLPVWFATKAECERWMAAFVAGRSWLRGEPTEIGVDPT